MFCPLPKKGRFDENGENGEFAFYRLKNKGLAPQTPENDAKMTKIAGVTQARHGLEKAGFVLP